MNIVIGFVVLAVAFSVLESLWPEVQEQPRWRKDSFTDLIYFFFNGVITRFAAAALLAIAIGLTAHGIARSGASIVGGQPRAVQVLEVLLLGDLVGYWTHRAFHLVPWLWRFHAIHHSPTQVDWLAASRVHPVESIISRMASVLVIYFAGFTSTVVAGYAPFLALYPIFLHCNLDWTYGPLRWLIASPGWHRWHHSADAEVLNKNFSGLFPFM
ncbi:MAG: sterol desaturase family protein, partial [Chloroflexota bacterium]